MEDGPINLKKLHDKELQLQSVIHEEEPAAYPWSVVENSWQGPQLDLQRDDLGADRVILEGWIRA